MFTGFGELSFRWIQICVCSPMRRSSSVKGIETKQHSCMKTYKISQCEDDSVIILENTDQVAPLLDKMQLSVAGLK